MDKIYEYTHDVEELDQILLDMQKGIQPGMMNPDLDRDLKMRLKEHKEAMLEDDDEDYISEVSQDRLTSKIQQNKRMADKSGGRIITISDSQKQQILLDMTESIVRTDHTSSYNQNDDMLYTSLEKKTIFQRLNSLRNIYYRQEDYQNAIKIINDAIEYAIMNEFPMYTESEVRKMFADGKIKYQRPIPKLYINYVKEITDRNILKGIVTGEINIIDTKEETKKSKRSKKECCCADKVKTVHNCEMMRRKLEIKETLLGIKDKTSDKYQRLLAQLEYMDCQKDKCVHYDVKRAEMDYEIIGPRENAQLVQLHRQGYETAISPAIRMKSGIYNKFALPANNMFATVGLEKQINPALINFDWFQPDAGKKYYMLLHNKKYGTNDLINDLSKDNDDQLTQLFRTTMNGFLTRLKYSSTGIDNSNEYSSDENYTSSSLQVNTEAAKMEEDILNAMRRHNINQ